MRLHVDGKRLFFVAALLAAALLGGYFYRERGAPTAANATQAAPASTNRISTVNGQTVVTVDTTAQAQSGIKTAPLSLGMHRSEVAAYGTVLDLQPLIALRSRYVSAIGDTEAAQAAAEASRQEFERNRSLYQDNQNVSLKTFQAAQAAYLADKAKVNAASLNAQNVRGDARQQFGDVVGRWAIDPHSLDFQKLLSRQDVLLRITLPPSPDSEAADVVRIDAAGNRGIPASLVSRSPQADPAAQGTPFIYRATVPLSAGTRVVAHVPTSKQSMQAIFVPGSAIVWYGGQPWTYVQVAPDRFARHLVPQQSPSEGGYYVEKGMQPGERVVVEGAQLLLSEETRPKTTGLACKDPECD